MGVSEQITDGALARLVKEFELYNLPEFSMHEMLRIQNVTTSGLYGSNLNTKL